MQEKIEKIWELLAKPDKDSFTTALRLFTELVNNKTYRAYMGKITPLNARYEDHKESWGVIINTTDERSRIIGDFTTILQKFEDEYGSSTDAKDNIKPDPHFEMLCKFNFEKQAKDFEAIMTTEKPFIPMVIRGTGSIGQRWLYSRLIKQYEAKSRIHSTIVIDLALKTYNLNVLIADLWGAIMGDTSLIEELERQQRQLKNAVADKLKTATQFIVLKNAYTFIHSDEFKSFKEMLTYFHNELLDTRNIKKCIIFFVEEQEDDYLHTNDCFCTSGDSKQITKIKEERTFKFILLPPIENLSNDVYQKWKGNISETYYKGLEGIAITPDYNNPQIVLDGICKKLNDFYKNLNINYEQWLIK